MQPNYEEMMRKQQQDYQRARDPFDYGRQVAQRRYSEIMANLDAQRASTQQSYSDMYQAARQRGVRQLASGGPTLSGGMGQQKTDFLSTAEIQAMGQIGSARNQAIRDLYTQGQAAFSNAQLEGQQAAQMEVQNRQTAFQLAQQRQAIMADSNLSDEQKQELLGALEGQPGVGAQIGATSSPSTFGQNVAKGITLAGSVGIAGSAAAKAFATGARRITTTGKLLKSGKILGSVGAKGGVTKAAAAFAKTAGSSKGIGAVIIGAKAGAVKLGLAKGALVGGKLALVGIGPVGWGILAVVGIGAAIGIGLTLANK